MKIALAYRRFGPGAAVPYYCWELARGLASIHETWAFTREFDAPPPRIRVVRFPLAFHSKRLEYGPNSALNAALMRAHRVRERYDVVHTQDGESFGGDLVTAHALLRVLYRVFRETDPDYVSWLPKSPLLWTEDLIYGLHRYRHVIATSEKMRESLRSVYGVRGEDVTVVRLGVAVEKFRPNANIRSSFRAAHDLPADARVLLHVSTDFQRKGLRTIIEALGQLPKEFTLVVAGRGKPEPFLEQAAKRGVRERVTFLGYQASLDQVYPAADLFVFPTQFDYFGYPILEAMACGVAPLVSCDAGVAELIRDGHNGHLLSNPSDPREVAQTVHDAAGETARLGRAARETAEGLSVTRMVDETVRVYEGLSRR